MGKHLSIAEKLNAENEFYENKIKMKWLREQLNILKYRNTRLERYISNSRRSKYSGLYAMNGVCYKLYGKKYKELNLEERKEYLRLKTKESKERRKLKAKLEDK